MVKQIGHINIIEKNICNLAKCNCGWNLTIGGTSKDDLKQILKAIKKHNDFWAECLLEED
jgi:hypothetical protein